MSTQDTTTRTATKPVLTTEDAMGVLQAALAKATELGAPMTIAVVDDAGVLKALVRMDGALNSSIDWAIDKTFTAASFRIPTQQLAQALETNPAWMASVVKLPHITLTPAGYPLLSGQSVVGGIGTSGGGRCRRFANAVERRM